MRKDILFAAYTDTELVTEFKANADQQALAELYTRYSGLLMGTCMKYLKDSDAAADACADIYSELVAKIPKYEIEHFKSWLYMLTKNHCLQRLRKDKRMQTQEFPEYIMQSEDDFNLELVMTRENSLNQLQTCIEGLKIEQKQAIELFYLKQKCYQEIVDETGIAWNTIRSNIQNGRRNLKNCMEANHG